MEDDNEEERSKLNKNLLDEFKRVEYPIHNPMEVAPYLSNGSETVFKGETIEFKASKFATKLRTHLKDGPNEGFPYQSNDEIVEDIIYALREEDLLD